jgi:hypothetical protein
MNTIQPRLLRVETVGDLPVLWACLQRLRLVDLFDQHFPTPPRWTGNLSCGEVVAVWLLFLTSQGDHCLNHLQPWVQRHHGTLQALLGKPLRPLDAHDDRLADLLVPGRWADLLVPGRWVRLTPREEIACPSCGSSFCLETASTTGWERAAGQKLGRFEVLAAVGQGAFGTVYMCGPLPARRFVLGVFHDACALLAYLRLLFPPVNSAERVDSEVSYVQGSQPGFRVAAIPGSAGRLPSPREP